MGQGQGEEVQAASADQGQLGLPSTERGCLPNTRTDTNSRGAPAHVEGEHEVLQAGHGALFPSVRDRGVGTEAVHFPDTQGAGSV